MLQSRCFAEMQQLEFDACNLAHETPCKIIDHADDRFVAVGDPQEPLTMQHNCADVMEVSLKEIILYLLLNFQKRHICHALGFIGIDVSAP